jgi:hypothetical protein
MLFDGQDLSGCSDEQWRQLRGWRIAMIFQDPMATLNPRAAHRHADDRGHPGTRAGVAWRGARALPRGAGARGHRRAR